MGKFKRLCLFVFALAGLCSLAALSLTWVGPWTPQARSMLEIRWYFTVLEVLVCITGLGFVVCLLAALFTPRNPKETVVAEVDGGEITVTRNAVVAQAKHVIEADGTCEAASVHVHMRKRGHVRVNVRVRPNRPVDVIERGATLYEELDVGLAKVCGQSVEAIGIVFLEPNQFGEGVATQVETSPRTERPRKAGDAREIVVSMNAAPESNEASEDASGQPAVDPEPQVDVAVTEPQSQVVSESQDADSTEEA